MDLATVTLDPDIRDDGFSTFWLVYDVDVLLTYNLNVWWCWWDTAYINQPGVLGDGFMTFPPPAMSLVGQSQELSLWNLTGLSKHLNYFVVG